MESLLYARYALGILWAWLHFIMNNEPLGLGTIIVYVRGEASPHSQCMWMLTLCRTKRRGALFPQRERGAMRHPQM